jgi:hypothetical protein
MRGFMVALAIACVAGAASAQTDDPSAHNGEVGVTEAIPQPPGGVKRQAETIVTASLTDPAGVTFRSVSAIVSPSVKHGAFADPVAGPVSVVCGQYASGVPDGGKPAYYWFFVAIKHSKLLWADVDQPADGQGVAYYSCKNAGLAN